MKSSQKNKRDIFQQTVDKFRKDFSLLSIVLNDEFVKWITKIEDLFNEWWRQTFEDEKIKEKFFKLKDSFWYKKEKTNKQSSIWEQFDQIAFIVNETLKISCKDCRKIMNHSTIADNSNTISMKKHWDINECQNKRRFSSQTQEELFFSRVSEITMK